MRLFSFLILLINITLSNSNLAPILSQNFNNLLLSEATSVNTTVFKLEGYDPEGTNVTFGLYGTDYFAVDPFTGEVTLKKPLDREKEDTLSFKVSIKDNVTAFGNIGNDNVVEVPATIIVLDENDNEPQFKNVPYETEVLEDAKLGTIILHDIVATDEDIVGETLELNCVPENSTKNACTRFILKTTESSNTRIKAMIILNTSLINEENMNFKLQISVTDGSFTTYTTIVIRVKDVQNIPPIFQGTMAAVIDEDSPIGTLVLKAQAKDGDTGNPRKIVYDLIENPMDYFVLDFKTGELRTAKPLDREILLDETGLVSLLIRARELVNGNPGTDNLTTSIATASITIRDVNDSPPVFNKNEYFTSIVENTPAGTPLSLEISVSDNDVGSNAIFSVHLDDVSKVFKVEPEVVRGYSQLNIRVENGLLDYENPNYRKFIILVIAEETNTTSKYSSTATVTVSVIDANDNRPIFDQESYTASVSESATVGQIITKITASDLDSGNFGTAGIRYSLTGTGAHKFNVNSKTGQISVSDCYAEQTLDNLNENDLVTNGSIDFNTNFVGFTTEKEFNTTQLESCLDYEKHSQYFLSYKATDDLGKGQTSVVSLRITIVDANDMAPFCESSLYRASLDEGAKYFDPPLIIKARDIDTISELTYKLKGDALIHKIFKIDEQTGEITLKSDAIVDVRYLKAEYLAFEVKVNDGLHSSYCSVNITIRDVNNHSPQFMYETYETSVSEDVSIGTKVFELFANDSDSGINAEVSYRIQHGSFDDFTISNKSGVVYVARKLDYDRRNTYLLQILATDSGMPSLSGTTTLTINIININDKEPFFTPTTQRVEVNENTPVGEVVYTLVAIDPDVDSINALEFAATEPITVIDKDGDVISKAEDYMNFFSIDRSGKVRVNKKLDRNLFAVITITILVTDNTASTIQQGRGSLIISIIDVNETPPSFNSPWSQENPKISIEVMEEIPITSVIHTLQAHDEESTISEFKISKNEYFIINATTGAIVTKARLDYEKINMIKFLVTVSDNGVPQLTSTANITVTLVNINDNDPIFLQDRYNFSVIENSPKDTFIGKIKAIDNDIGTFGEIMYYLTGEYVKEFILDSETGILTVANSSFIDHEENPFINLSVIASDRTPVSIRRTSTANILIEVIDINDNPPIFEKDYYFGKVAENAVLDPPAALLQVKASDKDEGTFGDICYFIIGGNTNNIFQIHNKSGILYPTKSLAGYIGTHNLSVKAIDGSGFGPHSDTVQITIEILSVNHHRPVFLVPNSSNATIKLSMDEIKSNYLIMTIKAIDNDTGDNGRISYHFQVDDSNIQETEDFSLNAETGELRTLRDLRKSEKNIYNLILVASDHGLPSKFESLRLLQIILTKSQEDLPDFGSSLTYFKFSITENNKRGAKVGKVQATVKKKHTNDLFYYILTGNKNEAFFIDKISGEIFANKSLDRETMDQYELFVLASRENDINFSLPTYNNFYKNNNSIAQILVNVLDENDNPPIFSKNKYFAGVSSKASSNEYVIFLNAIDKDFGENASFNYEIIASKLYKYGSSKSVGSIIPSPFAISKEGRVTTAAFMAEYNQDRFELSVIAKEIQTPKRLAVTKLFIWVFSSDQLIRVILSQPPAEVHKHQEEILQGMENATQKYIIIDEIRYHVDGFGRIRMDWCDLLFHAVEYKTQEIVPVDTILQIIDKSYDSLKEYYTSSHIQNILPAYANYNENGFDLAVVGLTALAIVLFIGGISFVVFCYCMRHWNLSVVDNSRKNTLIKKQFIKDLYTTENPLWIEQKLKLYEEQELSMQVFSESEFGKHMTENSSILVDQKSILGKLTADDNSYATIQPRTTQHVPENSDYATLANNLNPSVFEFTGSTFQAPLREHDDLVTELI